MRAKQLSLAGLAALMTLLVAELGGCAAGRSVEAFESAEDAQALEHDETGLWYQAEEFDESLQHSGALLDDPALERYLQSVVDRLFPEFQRALRVRVFHSTVPNAFVIAHGPLVSSGAQLDDGHIVDIAPTILDILGVEPPGHFDGQAWSGTLGS